MLKRVQYAVPDHVAERQPSFSEATWVIVGDRCYFSVTTKQPYEATHGKNIIQAIANASWAIFRVIISSWILRHMIGDGALRLLSF